MTLQEWFGLGAFVLASGTTVVGVTRWMIMREVAAKVAVEKEERIKGLLEAVTSRNTEMEKLRKDWNESQSSQDRNFGEVGLSLRRFIETVEKDMHEAELWGRDHYVQKGDFKDAVEKIESLVREGNAEIKADLKALQARIEQRRTS